jgi:phosphate/sulfate permease
MEQNRLQARFVPGWVVAVFFGIAVFLAVDFLFTGAPLSDSRALLGAVLALGIVITYMRGVNERDKIAGVEQCDF